MLFGELREGKDIWEVFCLALLIKNAIGKAIRESEE